MNLYERLGVSPKAEEDEIHRAFLKKSRTQHPDKFARWCEKQEESGRTFTSEERVRLQGEWTKAFQELTFAHVELMDPYNKQQYDRTGTTSAERDEKEAEPGPTVTQRISLIEQLQGGQIQVKQTDFTGTVKIKPGVHLPYTITVPQSKEHPRGATVKLELESAEEQRHRQGDDAITFMRIDLGGSDWECRVEQALDVRDALTMLLGVRQAEDATGSHQFLDQYLCTTKDLEKEQSKRSTYGGKDSEGKNGGYDLLAVLDVTPEQASEQGGPDRGAAA